MSGVDNHPATERWGGLTSLLGGGVRRVRLEVAPRTILLVLGIAAGWWMIEKLTAVLTVIIVALVLVGTLDPIVAGLQRRGLTRGRALALVFAIGAGALCGIAFVMVPPLLGQVAHLVADAPAERARLVSALHDAGFGASMVNAIRDLPIDTLSQQVGARVFGYSTALFVALGYGMSTLFLAIYLLADADRSVGVVYALTPRRVHVKLAKMLLELKIIVGGYMRGQLITSGAIALFVFVLLTVAGADNALPIALFAGITDIIPFVGGYIASTPVVIAVLPQGAKPAVILLVLMLAYQQFESRVLVPRVYGRVLRLTPAIVLVALLAGASLAGILGALLALPIAAGMQMVLRELRVELPGAAHTGQRELALDRRASLVYEQLVEGLDAVEAGKVASNLAASVKQAELAPPPADDAS